MALGSLCIKHFNFIGRTLKPGVTGRRAICYPQGLLHSLENLGMVMNCLARVNPQSHVTQHERRSQCMSMKVMLA